MARSRSIATKKPRRKKTTTTQKRLRMDDIPLQAMSVDQFCHAHNIHRDTFYALLKQGRAPECMRLGTRRLISFESAARWRAEHETKEVTETV